MNRTGLFNTLTSFLIALAGAWLASLIHSPLPWMIGALLATAIFKIGGLQGSCPGPLRNAGQWVIGTSLGLYFTSEMLRTIGHNMPFIVAGMLFALALGIVGSIVLHRWAQVDFKTAWFSSAIGGASEMANLAERHHARVDLVASAHSLRMMLVVVSIPFIFDALGIQGNDTSLFSSTRFFDPFGFIGLLAITSVAGYGFHRAGLPNPWVLGPMLATLLLTSQDIVLTHLPTQITNAGQLCIGWALGSKFGPTFFRKAPRFIAVVAIANIANIVLVFGFSYLLYKLSDLPYATLVLSTSPGGIAEMAITAKVLMLGAPVVSSFHVLRMVFILLITAPLYEPLRRLIEQK